MGRPKKKAQEQQIEGTINTVFGRVELPPVQVEESDKKLGLFDLINDINFNKQYLYDEDQTYEPFLVNRAMTIFPDTFGGGEFLNSHHHLDKKLQYDYLFFSVQKRKRFKQGGWLKRSEEEKLEIKTLHDVSKAINRSMRSTIRFWSLLNQDKRQEFLSRYVYPDSANA